VRNQGQSNRSVPSENINTVPVGGHGSSRVALGITPTAPESPPFQILIVSEQKSIGREMSQTGYLIKQLPEAGVEIFGTWMDDH
jgi:hypothetical protein